MQSNPDALAVFARSRELRAAALQGARNSLAKAVSEMQWSTVADLREQTIPVFAALFERVETLGAADACRVWDAMGCGQSTLAKPDDLSRAPTMVHAAARLIDQESRQSSGFVGELQRQLQIAYDQAKGFCFDAQQS